MGYFQKISDIFADTKCLTEQEFTRVKMVKKKGKVKQKNQIYLFTEYLVFSFYSFLEQVYFKYLES